MADNKRHILRYIALFLGTFLLDRVSKWLVLATVQYTEPVLPWLNIVVVWNRGVSFSLFHFDSPLGFWLLTACIMAIIALFFCYSLYQHRVQHKKIYWELLVLAGALSNVVDRFVYGGVLDFIDFYWKSWHFATFNIADVLVFIGVVGIFIQTLVEQHDKQD